jgi:hypothetical protein
MCSRHLPQSQPLTFLQATLYVKPSRRLPKPALLTSAPILSVSGQFRPPATCSMYFAAVSRSLGSSQLHCARDFQPGMSGIGATASVRIMILTTLGEAARHPRNRHLAFLRRASAGHRQNACPVEPKQWRIHAASARRIVRHPRVAPFLLRLIPLLSLIQPTAAAARPAATHPRGSALHHLII